MTRRVKISVIHNMVTCAARRKSGVSVAWLQIGVVELKERLKPHCVFH
jgi:hypothetical protein